MKIRTVITAIIAASMFFPALVQALSDSSSSLEKQVADAQKQVDEAQAAFDLAQEKAESGMTPSGKTEWRQAETKYESLTAKRGDQKKITAQEDVVQELESRLMSSSARSEVDSARNDLADARARLDQAKSRLSAARQKNNDDSSQFTQPENRTQNGSNFSIRSQRDSESHPPLPASQ